MVNITNIAKPILKYFDFEIKSIFAIKEFALLLFQTIQFVLLSNVSVFIKFHIINALTNTPIINPETNPINSIMPIAFKYEVFIKIVNIETTINAKAISSVDIIPNLNDLFVAFIPLEPEFTSLSRRLNICQIIKNVKNVEIKKVNATAPVIYILNEVIIDKNTNIINAKHIDDTIPYKRYFAIKNTANNENKIAKTAKYLF